MPAAACPAAPHCCSRSLAGGGEGADVSAGACAPRLPLPLVGLLGPARASPSAVHLYFSRVCEISNFVATVWGYLPSTYLIFL